VGLPVLELINLASKWGPQLWGTVGNPRGNIAPVNDGEIGDKDVALITIRQKLGAVVVSLGTRDTGKTTLGYRIAEFIGKPTYAITPEQRPPRWVKRMNLADIDLIPSDSTVVLDDLPVVASNRDYNNALVNHLERIIPMVRHERRWHLIFNSQSAAQADRYILDCDLAFMKPLGLLMKDVERPGIRKWYRDYVDPAFDGQSELWIKQHAFMLSRQYKGIIKINKSTGAGMTLPEGLDK